MKNSNMKKSNIKNLFRFSMLFPASLWLNNIMAYSPMVSGGFDSSGNPFQMTDSHKSQYPSKYPDLRESGINFFKPSAFDALFTITGRACHSFWLGANCTTKFIGYKQLPNPQILGWCFFRL